MSEHTRKTSTNIRVKYGTKEKLENLGAFGESYDSVIQRLIKVYLASHDLAEALKEKMT